jgi:penicillin-binding protein 1A
MATAAGIRTPVSHNYAMILGGLKVGVSTLDMAHAYETFADGGKRMYNRLLGSTEEGPTGIAELQCPDSKLCAGHRVILDKPRFRRVMPPRIAHELHDMLTGVVQSGTGTAAAISGVDVAGKTGTTTNYADAWFVGWTPQMTTAVWVGYPNKLVPMTTLYNGGPVEGGTFPAIIWHSFMLQALQILASEQPAGSKTSTTPTTSTLPTLTSPSAGPSTTPTTSTTPTAPSAANGGNANRTGTATTQGGGGTTPRPTSTAPGTGTGSGGGGGGGTGNSSGGGTSTSGGAGVGGTK